MDWRENWRIETYRYSGGVPVRCVLLPYKTNPASNLCMHYEGFAHTRMDLKDGTTKCKIHRPTTIRTSSLEHVFKTNNYIPIVSFNNYRDSDNFIRATGFCVDNDEGTPIAEAKKKLNDLKLNFALVLHF